MSLQLESPVHTSITDFRWVGNKLWTLGSKTTREGMTLHLAPALPTETPLLEFEVQDSDRHDVPTDSYHRLLVSAPDALAAALAGVNFLLHDQSHGSLDMIHSEIGWK